MEILAGRRPARRDASRLGDVPDAHRAAPPGRGGLHIDWSYDALFTVKDTYPARQGAAMIERHWPVGEIAPVNLLAVAQQPQSPDAWSAAAAAVTDALRNAPDVADVRAVSNPLGLSVASAKNNAMLLLFRNKILPEFISPDAKAMRMAVTLKTLPFSRTSMDDVPQIAVAANGALQQSHAGLTLSITGATAEMIDMSALTRQDFAHIAPLAMIVILMVVMFVLRDALLSMFIVAATVLSYFTTLGLTDMFFHTLGATGLEWKVQMLLFIVLVAVGQDYSIFFAMRLAQESREFRAEGSHSPSPDFHRPGDQQLRIDHGRHARQHHGRRRADADPTRLRIRARHALDTFLVRPLLLPAFVILSGRTLHRAVVYTRPGAQPPITTHAD